MSDGDRILELRAALGEIIKAPDAAIDLALRALWNDDRARLCAPVDGPPAARGARLCANPSHGPHCCG